MGRSPCCVKEGISNKGAWTALEDQILIDYINTHGEGKWRRIPKQAGLKQCGKSCRLRWRNYLRPDIKRGNITPEGEDLIVRLHKLLRNRWSLTAGRIPGRMDNEIKNYWKNATLRRKVMNNVDTNKNDEKNKKLEKKNKTKYLEDQGMKISEEENNTISTTNYTTTTNAVASSISDEFLLDFDVGKLFNVPENIQADSSGVDCWELGQYGVSDKGLSKYKFEFSEEMLKDWMEDCFDHPQC